MVTEKWASMQNSLVELINEAAGENFSANRRSHRALF